MKLTRCFNTPEATIATSNSIHFSSFHEHYFRSYDCLPKVISRLPCFILHLITFFMTCKGCARVCRKGVHCLRNEIDSKITQPRSEVNQDPRWRHQCHIIGYVFGLSWSQANTTSNYHAGGCLTHATVWEPFLQSTRNRKRLITRMPGLAVQTFCRKKLFPSHSSAVETWATLTATLSTLVKFLFYARKKKQSPGGRRGRQGMAEL